MLFGNCTASFEFGTKETVINHTLATFGRYQESRYDRIHVIGKIDYYSFLQLPTLQQCTAMCIVIRRDSIPAMIVVPVIDCYRHVLGVR